MTAEEPKKKILIVEDDATTQKALFDKFIREGFSVLTAGDGEEALKTALEEKPDIILLDIVLPKMDGLTMFKKLRQDERGKNIPVIVLTILSDAEKVAEALQGGIYSYLVKTDYQISDIVKKVRERLA